MAGSTVYSDQRLYLLNSHTINELYAFLRTTQSSAELTYSTEAGVFTFDAQVAKNLLRTLENWDASESVSGKPNNDIDPATIYSKLDTKRFHANSGFELPFKRFQPNELWLQNYRHIEQAMANGWIRLTPESNVGIYSDQENLWQVITDATLSGATPERFSEIAQYCGSASSTYLYALKWWSPFRHTSTVKRDTHELTQVIYANFSQSLDNAAGDCVHERGHGLYLKAAVDGGYKLFRDLILARAVKDPKYRHAASVMQEVLEWSQANPRFAGATQYDTQYTIEEMGDVAFFQHINSSFIDQDRAEWSKHFANALKMNQEDFNLFNRNRFGIPVGTALYWGFFIHRAEGQQVSPDIITSLKAKVKKSLQGDARALKLFDAMLTLGKVVDAYIASPEFTALIREYIPQTFAKK